MIATCSGMCSAKSKYIFLITEYGKSKTISKMEVKNLIERNKYKSSEITKKTLNLLFINSIFALSMRF